MTGAFVLASDANFVTPLGVALRSLGRLVPAGGRAVVLQQGIEGEDAAWLRRQAGDGLTLELVEVTERLIAGAKLPPHLPPATLFRLLLGQLVDPEVERVVYLDVDLLIRDDPSPLLEVRIEGIGAVRDTYRPWIGGRPFLPWVQLGLDPSTPYFNAGVLAVDTRWWREERVGERCLDLLRDHRLGYADQDALNLLLAGGWTSLPARWNVQTDIFRDEALGWVTGPVEEHRAAREDPAIVHFTGSDKPWNSAPSTGFRADWLALLAETSRAEWASVPSPSRLRQLVARARRKAARAIAGD